MRSMMWIWLGGCASSDVPPGLALPWTADLPEHAVEVTAEELAELDEIGELVPVDPDERQARRDREAERDAEARELVEELLQRRPELTARFDYTPPDGVDQLADGNFLATRPSGQQLVLMGHRHLTRDAAATLRARDDAEMQRKQLRALHPTMPRVCRDAVEGPAEWDAMDAPALVAALDAMTDCFAEALDRGDVTELPPSAEPAAWPGGLPRDPGEQAVGPEYSSDCFDESQDPPVYLVSGAIQYGLPYPAPYAGPVKNQGRRGSCVAMATVSALEYFVARNFGRSTNLSEQATYALGKAIFYDDWFDDGMNTTDFLQDLADDGSAIPFEGRWTYNRSTQRIEGYKDLSGKASFADVCKGYSGAMCGENAPQTGLHCTGSGDDRYCYIWTPSLSDGYSVPDAINVGGFDDDDLNELKAYLFAGYSAVLAIDVTEAFKDIDGVGYWVDAIRDDSDEVGGHAVHVLAYREGTGLAQVFPTEDAVLIKNSWGCDWGDLGYSWIPISWIQDHFKSITVVLAEREGANAPPEVTITAPANGTRIPWSDFFPESTRLEATATDLEDGDDCCTFRWWSSEEGDLGTGATLDHTFVVPGVHVVRAYATDSEGRESSDAILIDLTNQAPTVTIDGPLRVYRGYTAVYTADAVDPNETLGLRCGDHRWTSSNPADTVPQTGCAVAVTFASTGLHTLQVEVTDRDGASATGAFVVEVVEPPAFGTPQVTIVQPLTDDTGIPNNLLNQLKAVVDNPLGRVLTYRWSWREIGNTGSGLLGTQPNHTWRPVDHVPDRCGGSDIEVTFEATDGSGTFSDTRRLFIDYPNC